MKIDHGKFIGLYKGQYGMLNDGQSSGMDKLLGFLEQDKDVSDLRWAAYMLATVKEECANTWQPIEEYGKGHGSPYGNPVRVTGRDGKTYVNIYYGRGYVQITGEGNYQKMSQRLSLGDQLVIHPERTLDPTAANTQMCIDVGHLNWNDGTAHSTLDLQWRHQPAMGSARRVFDHSRAGCASDQRAAST